NLDDTIQQLADMAFKNKSENIFQDIVSKLERHMIKKALELTNGNQVHAARLLGISRNTLRKKQEEV
ncbi:MAG: helix-turn-helix domain-containing protein, partial [Planctomycetota bacterium]